MDGLHEDLNRIQKKPLIPAPTAAREKELETLPQQIAGAEEWQLYRFRDDSVVVDYFQGQFRNRLTCLSCENVSGFHSTRQVELKGLLLDFDDVQLLHVPFLAHPDRPWCDQGLIISVPRLVRQT